MHFYSLIIFAGAAHKSIALHTSTADVRLMSENERFAGGSRIATETGKKSPLFAVRSGDV